MFVFEKDSTGPDFVRGFVSCFCFHSLKNFQHRFQHPRPLRMSLKSSCYRNDARNPQPNPTEAHARLEPTFRTPKQTRNNSKLER